METAVLRREEPKTQVWEPNLGHPTCLFTLGNCLEWYPFVDCSAKKLKSEWATCPDSELLVPKRL
jgi:hypothetical protein